MDPFIEAADLWVDFHDSLIGELARLLKTRVPQKYVVRLGARSYVAVEKDEPLTFAVQPDISVKRRGVGKKTRRSRSTTPRSSGTATMEPPVIIPALVEAEHREPFIEIFDVRPDRHLVTAIEVLSPSNKRTGTAGCEEYQRKRRVLLNGAAHFVEIDLLRGGERMPMRKPWPDSPYYVLVARRNELPNCGVWPAYATKRLPHIPVPLEPGDADISIDLQPIVDGIYERSRYAADIVYRQKTSAKLSADELELISRFRKPSSRPRS
jgi:hypothetical protein